MANGTTHRVAIGVPATRSVSMDLVNYFRNSLAPWVRARINPKTELGASLVEYALLVALIAVVAIIAIRFLGTSASSKFSSTGSQITN